MSVRLKILTTVTFNDEATVEEYLKQGGAFEPHQAVELLEERRLTISAGVENEIKGVETPTVSVFTLEDM